MKRFYLILSLVAMLFTSCEGVFDNGANDDNVGGGNEGGGSANGKLITAIVNYPLGGEISDASSVIYLSYDENGQIKSIQYTDIEDNYPTKSTLQTITYSTPITITSEVQEIVKDADSNRTILHKSKGASGVAYLNSLGFLSSLSYGEYYSCSLSYDATTHRISAYTGGSGYTMPFTWENGNLTSFDNEATLSYTDTSATWGGFDWFFMMANGGEVERLPIYTMNTNHGLLSKNLPSTITVDGRVGEFSYTFNDDGSLSAVKFGEDVFEFFYEGEVAPAWQWEEFDEIVETE